MFVLRVLVCVTIIDVSGKPRSVSSTNISKIKVKDKNEELSFDVIAFPPPTVSGVWFAEPTTNSSELSYDKTSVVNASCKSDRKHRYISRCTLTMLGNASYSRTGWYKIEVTNNHGDENFTVEISYGEWFTIAKRVLNYILLEQIKCSSLSVYIYM